MLCAAIVRELHDGRLAGRQGGRDPSRGACRQPRPACGAHRCHPQGRVQAPHRGRAAGRRGRHEPVIVPPALQGRDVLVRSWIDDLERFRANPAHRTMGPTSWACGGMPLTTWHLDCTCQLDSPSGRTVLRPRRAPDQPGISIRRSGWRPRHGCAVHVYPDLRDEGCVGRQQQPLSPAPAPALPAADLFTS